MGRSIEIKHAQSVGRPLKQLFNLDELLGAIRAGNAPPVPTKIDHFFAENQYVRTMHVEAGGLIIGKKHRHKTLNVLVKGRMLVYTKASKAPVLLSEGDFFESGTQTRKVLIALTDCSFSNIHVTDKKSVNEIENEFIEPESAAMLEKDLIEIFNTEADQCLG